MKPVFTLTMIQILLSFFFPLAGEDPPGRKWPAERPAGGDPADGPVMMFWNLENFFDWRDEGGGDSDREFSSRGERHWTRGRFRAKARAVGKTLLWAGTKAGQLPDAVGLAEVENAFVLDQMLKELPFRKLDYRYVHFDSPDHRGIDVALLYRSSSFRVVSARPMPAGTVRGRDTLRTRDILLVQLEETSGGRSWWVLVCHLPSKYGGGDSDWRREWVSGVLCRVCDSLRHAGRQRIVVMGDFNDTPDSPAFRRLTAGLPETATGGAGAETSSDGLVNLAAPLAAAGEGSIRFEGRWQLIDQVYVPPGLAAGSALSVLHPPFLTVHDNIHSGDKPLRTYSGPRYLGGVSDHRPLLLRLP